MAKDRMAVTCNGRTAFYACMYEDIRKCAMDCGWAVSLHGSLASDMDIMAMPWVDNAVSFKEMIDRVSKLFKDNDISSQYVITYNEKPHNRVVATVPIFADFYLDISTINIADVVPKSEIEELIRENESLAKTVNEASSLIRKLRNKVEKSQTEVTREIFEDIAKSVASKIPMQIRPVFKDDRDFDAGVIDGKREALSEVLVLIATLEKKYIPQ